MYANQPDQDKMIPQLFNYHYAHTVDQQSQPQTTTCPPVEGLMAAFHFNGSLSLMTYEPKNI